jgi:hypothetical protein
MSVTLDYLGESVSDRAEATAAADQYLEIIDRIVAERIDGNVSLKLTQMGQDIDEDFLRSNVGRVLERAREHDMFVRFDMESSDYVQRTLDFFGRIWDDGQRNTGIVLQSMLRRTEADVLWANERGIRVRLCKGAYAEPDTVAFPRQARRGRQLRPLHPPPPRARPLPRYRHPPRSHDRSHETVRPRPRHRARPFRVPTPLRRPPRPPATARGGRLARAHLHRVWDGLVSVLHEAAR